MTLLCRLSPHLLLFGGLALCVPPASASVVHRALLTRTAPMYPELARRMHIWGKVVLLVTVQPNGTVSTSKIQSGHALLAQAAQDAVRKWRFSPNAEVTESEIEISFTLADQ